MFNFSNYLADYCRYALLAKNIRDDKGYWNQIESYIQEHSEALFSHGICPDCTIKLYGDEDWYKSILDKTHK